MEKIKMETEQLPGNNVEIIEIDSEGNKWLGVQFHGLTVFKGENIEESQDLHKKK